MRSVLERVLYCIRLSIFIARTAGKSPLGRPRHRWEDNVRMDIKEIGINMRNWVDSSLEELGEPL